MRYFLDNSVPCLFGVRLCGIELYSREKKKSSSQVIISENQATTYQSTMRGHELYVRSGSSQRAFR
mgnify:CR=1 FL=1|jgi:hypothetical protein